MRLEKQKILIVDDERKMRNVLRRMLQDSGYETTTAENGLDCLELADSFLPDLILLDLKMPVMDGHEAMQTLISRKYPGKIIVITAFGSIPAAVKAIQEGAFDFITKPFDMDQLMIAIKRALQQNKLEKELRSAKSELETQKGFSRIITNDPSMKELISRAQKVATSDVSVLITGSSGTGKELFAKAIHQCSNRVDKPFVALNCGALPENLVESELFGYKKGAFTNADRSKEGLVEKADGGTLFLDEIGEMGPDIQVKLLRFTQFGEFMPLGSTQSKNVNVRIIAATNRDLKDAVAEGLFREDLFYRLNVVNLTIPDLAERSEDIPVLAKHFVNKLGKEMGKESFTISRQALAKMKSYNWPGNIRELENVIHGALVLTDSSPLTDEFLPDSLQESNPINLKKERELPSLQDMLESSQEEIEKNAILEALKQCNGKKAAAARKLGISRSSFFRKLKQYEIK